MTIRQRRANRVVLKRVGGETTAVPAVVVGDEPVTAEDIRSAKARYMTRFGFDVATRFRREADYHDRLLAAREEVRMLCPDIVTAGLLVNAVISLSNAKTKADRQRRTNDYRDMRLQFILQTRAFVHPGVAQRVDSFWRTMVRFLYRKRH